jgi:hypothetical protein
VRNIVLEAEYAEELGLSRDRLRQARKGLQRRGADAAQIMIHAWRA